MPITLYLISPQYSHMQKLFLVDTEICLGSVYGLLNEFDTIFNDFSGVGKTLKKWAVLTEK